jgi:hydrogenase maturation protease
VSIEPARPLTGEQNTEPLSLKEPESPTRVLVAGMGNVLQWDDGWGIAVVQKLARHTALPANAKVIEVGMAGMSLVQELLDGYGALVIVDAAERGGSPGTIYLLEPEIPDLAQWPYAQRQDFLADMHYTNPSKALVLARSLGVLPPKVFILGCQPATIEGLGIGLSEPVNLAVDQGVERLITAIRQLS